MKDKLYYAYMNMKAFFYLLKKVSLIKFTKYNFFSKNVVREKGVYIYPTKGAIIEFSKGSVLHIKGDLHIGYNLLKGSKTETFIRLRENATFTTQGSLYIYYAVSIDVFRNAHLNIGDGEINCYSSIMCNQKIDIGKNVLIARNVYIYDSDFHKLYDEYMGIEITLSENVVIGDNVWLCIKSSVLKGTIVEDGAIVPAHKKVQGSTVKKTFMKRM